MKNQLPFFREAGAGPGVVCIHSNASSSSQWRGLMDRLSGRFRVFAPDSLGAGKSPPWPAAGEVCLRDEVALLEPVFAMAGDPFFLVGHSYGASVALVTALTHPGRVRAWPCMNRRYFLCWRNKRRVGRQPKAFALRHTMLLH